MVPGQSLWFSLLSSWSDDGDIILLGGGVLSCPALGSSLSYLCLLVFIFISVFLSVRMRPVRIRLCWLCRLCRVVLPILWHLLMRGPAVRRTKPRWSVADDTTGHTDSLPFCLVFLLVFASIIIPRSQPIPSGWGFWQAFSMSILP